MPLRKGVLAMTLHDFISKFIEPGHPNDRSAARATRELTSWIFTLARNLVVLGGLKFVADRTKNPYVEIASNICLLFLALFIFSYWQEIYMRLFSRFTKGTWAEIADFALNVVTGVAIMYGSINVIDAIETALIQVR